MSTRSPLLKFGHIKKNECIKFLEKYDAIILVLRNNAYMPYISLTLDGKRQTIIQDPLLHTSFLDSLNSLVVNDEDYSLKLDRNEYFLLYFF